MLEYHYFGFLFVNIFSLNYYRYFLNLKSVNELWTQSRKFLSFNDNILIELEKVHLDFISLSYYVYHLHYKEDICLSFN